MLTHGASDALFFFFSFLRLFILAQNEEKYSVNDLEEVFHKHLYNVEGEVGVTEG